MPKFKVTVEWTTTDVCEQEFEVEADTPEAACVAAEELAADTGGGWSKPQIVEGSLDVVDIKEIHQ